MMAFMVSTLSPPHQGPPGVVPSPMPSRPSAVRTLTMRWLAWYIVWVANRWGRWIGRSRISAVIARMASSPFERGTEAGPGVALMDGSCPNSWLMPRPPLCGGFRPMLRGRLLSRLHQHEVVVERVVGDVYPVHPVLVRVVALQFGDELRLDGLHAIVVHVLAAIEEDLGRQL